MARELLASWGDVQSALDRLLGLAEREIKIYDGNLERLKLGSSERCEHLRRLLRLRRTDCLRIALQDTTLLRRDNPRLMKLLADYSTGMTVMETADQLAHLRDTMILADDRHGLILFERNQPRSKLVVDEIDELRPYFERFEQIWQEGGSPVGATTLGL